MPQLAVIKVKKQTYQEHINRYGKMREGFLAKKRLVIPAVMAMPALFHFEFLPVRGTLLWSAGAITFSAVSTTRRASR